MQNGVAATVGLSQTLVRVGSSLVGRLSFEAGGPLLTHSVRVSLVSRERLRGRWDAGTRVVVGTGREPFLFTRD